MIKSVSAILGLALLLCACSTPEEIAARKQLRDEADSNTCQSYGLRPGSEAFGNCRLQIDLARERRNYSYDPYPAYPFNAGIYYGHFR